MDGSTLIAGMDARAYIATHLMAGLLANMEVAKTLGYAKHKDPGFDANKWMAESAVVNADALLAALKGPTPLAREIMRPQ